MLSGIATAILDNILTKIFDNIDNKSVNDKHIKSDGFLPFYSANFRRHFLGNGLSDLHKNFIDFEHR